MGERTRRQFIVTQRRQQVADLYLKGWAQGAIAEHLQAAQSTISNDLKRIQQQWRASTIRDFDARVTMELQKIDRLEREAWAAWERSQKPSQQARVKASQSDQNADRTIKNQVGDPRFLEQVHKCIASRRAILGLDAPAQVEPVLPAPVPLTAEQRNEHVEAIILALKQSQVITVDEADGLRRIEAAAD